MMMIEIMTHEMQHVIRIGQFIDFGEAKPL
jgi:uncharacterized protein YjaZ